MDKENQNDELTQKQKIYEIEKKLGRHSEEKKKKIEKNGRLIKYFLIASNMMYTLVLPILIMLGGYLLLEKYVFKQQQPIVLIVFLIIGVFSGYWSLIKQLTSIK